MEGKTPHEQELAADGGHRARIIQGLHSAARWFEAHPDIPVPLGITIQYTAPGPAEVNRIAAASGEEAIEANGTCETRHYFGPAVSYTATAISSDRRAAWNRAMQVFEAGQAGTAPVAA